MAASDIACTDGARYVYADNAATTPLSPSALAAMMPYLTERFGNPSGIHRVAREAAEALAAAREHLAGCLGAEAREVYFTSGGSESDAWVLTGAVQRFRDIHGAEAPVRLITSEIEHHAVLHTAEELARQGAEVIYLPVDKVGQVEPAALEEALAHAEEANRASGSHAPAAALVSIMLANNEVGTIQPIAALARIAHAHRAPFHTDAVQAVGHIPVNVRDLAVDALSLSAHKFHGPRGTGALYLREGFSIPPLIRGGAQERGERAGTENLAGAIGMTAALEEALADLDERMRHVADARDELVRHVLAEVPNVRLTGDPARSGRLPGIASFVCHDVDGELLVVLLDAAGIAAATGSACSTGSTDPSHVVTALGIRDPRWARGSLRLSLADDISPEDLALLMQRVPEQIMRARSLSATV